MVLFSMASTGSALVTHCFDQVNNGVSQLHSGQLTELSQCSNSSTGSVRVCLNRTSFALPSSQKHFDVSHAAQMLWHCHRGLFSVGGLHEGPDQGLLFLFQHAAAVAAK